MQNRTPALLSFNYKDYENKKNAAFKFIEEDDLESLQLFLQQLINHKEDWADLLFACLNKATEIGQDEMVSFLLTLSKAHTTHLLSAIKSGNIDTIRLIATHLMNGELKKTLHESWFLSALFNAASQIGQVDIFELLIKEFHFDFCQINEPEINKIFDNLIYLYNRTIIGNPVNCLKYILNNTDIDARSEIGKTALHRAVDFLDASIARVLLAYGATFDEEKKIELKERTQSKRPYIRKFSDKIELYQKTIHQLSLFEKIDPVSIEDLDKLTIQVCPDWGNGRLIPCIKEHTHFLLDYIEAQLMYQAKGYRQLSENSYHLLNNLIKLTVFYHVRKGNPEIILPIFDIEPTLVNLKDKDSNALLTILLSPYTGSEVAPVIHLESVNVFINALYKHGYHFDEMDGSGKNAWQLLADAKMLFPLQKINPLCGMRKVMDLIYQGKIKQASLQLTFTMKNDLSFVIEYIQSLIIAANQEASFSINSESAMPIDDVNFNDYSFLPNLILLYQEVYKSLFANNVYMHIAGYNAEDSNVLEKCRAFKNTKEKIEFINKLSSKTSLPLTSNWFSSKDWKQDGVNNKISTTKIGLFATERNEQNEQEKLLDNEDRAKTINPF